MEIAASCGKVDELTFDCSDRYIYPKQADQCVGCIDCKYVNFAGQDDCSNTFLPIGSYNEETIYEKATSPSGLYDMCGNAAEWVEQNRFDNYYSMSRGFSYQDGDVNTMEYDLIYDDDETLTRSIIGFRSVMPAKEIIQAIKESLE